MFVTETPEPDEQHQRQGHRNCEVHDKACNRKPDFLMQACAKEPSAMGPGKVHRIMDVFGEYQSNEPPEDNTPHKTDIHPVGSQILHCDERDEDPKEQSHFFFNAFQR